MPIFKIDSHMDKHPVLLVIDKWWIILIRNGFNRIAKINLGDFSQSGCLFWFFIFIFSIQWRLIVTIGHSIKMTQTGCIPLTIKIDTLCSNAEKLALDSWSGSDGGRHMLWLLALAPGALQDFSSCHMLYHLMWCPPRTRNSWGGERGSVEA